MPSANRSAFLVPVRGCLGALAIVAALAPSLVRGQVVILHGSTPEGDLLRAKADAALLLKQAELVGERANAQRLDNMMKECDVAYKRMVTDNKTKGTLASKFERTFDVIRFNQQLAEIRSELEHKAAMHRTRVGDPTDEMNSLLEKFARQHVSANRIPAMRTELTPEQLDAIFLTDGSNTFSGKTGKTRLEAFRWPFLIQRKEFQEERSEFDVQCDQAVKEINGKGTASPETIMALLKKVEAIDNRLDTLPLSDNPSMRAVESKWRKEAKAFTRELTRTLANCSKLDSDKLSKYVFQGKTLGELIDHLDSNGLRFSHPGEQDANLYASLFFIMRYADQAIANKTQGGEDTLRTVASIVGKWNWGGGNTDTAIFEEDGSASIRRAKGKRVKGKWKCLDEKTSKYQIVWDNGYVDDIRLTGDGNELSGHNNHDRSFSHSRLKK